MMRAGLEHGLPAAEMSTVVPSGAVSPASSFPAGSVASVALPVTGGESSIGFRELHHQKRRQNNCRVPPCPSHLWSCCYCPMVAGLRVGPSGEEPGEIKGAWAFVSVGRGAIPVPAYFSGPQFPHLSPLVSPMAKMNSDETQRAPI